MTRVFRIVAPISARWHVLCAPHTGRHVRTAPRHQIIPGLEVATHA